MGNTASGEEGRHRLGYHVLRVKDDSPAYRAGIRPFFDYITAVNGVRLNSETTYLQDQMLAHEDKPLMLDIYSTREQAGRRVEMIPTRKWGDGNGGLIGCSIRFCMFDAVNDVVWHILDVAQGSPAEKAGLCAHSDYVIGTPYGIMRGEGDLYDLVEDNIGEPLRLHVYNSETDHVREASLMVIVIIPNEEWGGEGLLGCDVGYGYLHRLPRQGSVQHRGSNGSPRKTPSLPYPPSHEMVADPSAIRHTLPASFLPGEQLDIVAPTPRPPQSPSWLNPSAILEGALQNASKKAESEEIQEQDLPPFRFGRGERPDAEDEPESEDEFVPRGGRGQAAHKESSALPPNFMNKFQQGISLHHEHDIHTPHPSLTGTEEYQTTATTATTQHLMSPTKAPPKGVDVNADEIPFGAGSTHDLSSTLGMNAVPFK
ncbi:Golgi reassembly-stacking protein 2 [Mortierella hygrophila]|uniref:Golgi reassembly-stacking protein 2 n=1 Tax=Mortierella hygrophila TaxID=979708 RepID=A0A9P6K805_9FUNG|nr:Golgi reassembly-stacking protein 2 [Mortierella hygrophila]